MQWGYLVYRQESQMYLHGSPKDRPAPQGAYSWSRDDELAGGSNIAYFDWAGTYHRTYAF